MNNRIEKIQKLLALANDASDEESMSALAKTQQLMLEYRITEEELFEYKQQQQSEIVMNQIIYEGRPQKWVYRLAKIIAKNFRVRFYYDVGSPIRLHFVGVSSDMQIAEITFLYAKGSIAYSSRMYMQQKEIRRKRKRKWQLKQDFIEGYLNALATLFYQQVKANSYELALQLPSIVEQEIEKLHLVKGKDTSHKIKDSGAYRSGYHEGLKFKQRDQIGGSQ